MLSYERFFDIFKNFSGMSGIHLGTIQEVKIHMKTLFLPKNKIIKYQCFQFFRFVVFSLIVCLFFLILFAPMHRYLDLICFSKIAYFAMI